MDLPEVLLAEGIPILGQMANFISLRIRSIQVPLRFSYKICYFLLHCHLLLLNVAGLMPW
jgi:hypothetical protein